MLVLKSENAQKTSLGSETPSASSPLPWSPSAHRQQPEGQQRSPPCEVTSQCMAGPQCRDARDMAVTALRVDRSVYGHLALPWRSAVALGRPVVLLKSESTRGLVRHGGTLYCAPAAVQPYHHRRY